MEYIVIFLNYDGTELYKTLVNEGETAVFVGDTPKKNGEKFIGWSKPLENVRDNMIVKAVFEKSKTLKLGAISFEQNDEKINVIEQAVISNEDLQINKETDIER